MAQHRYVALLRGINVGGSNIIKMADLKASFEELGYEGVRTYIQSGNVVFCAKTKQSAKTLVARIEKALTKRFGYSSRIVVVSAADLARAVYFKRLIAKVTKSRLSRVVQLPIYQNLTIRNWNTTTKLLALVDSD